MVRAIMIVEMAGRPAEHLVESLEKHVKILYDVSDIEVNRIEVSEARLIEQKEGESAQEMFTAFAECEFEVPSFARLSETMFDFMPSSVEVVDPDVIVMNCVEATNLLNNISGRMHRYDDFAKIAGERMKQMGAQLELAKKILEAKDKEIAELKKGSEKKVKKAVKKAKKAVKKAKKKVKKAVKK